jgi:hypothetical protein
VQLSNLSGPSLPPEDLPHHNGPPDLKGSSQANSLERLHQAVSRVVRHPARGLTPVTDVEELETIHDAIEEKLGFDVSDSSSRLSSTLLTAALNPGTKKGYAFVRVADPSTGQAMYPTSKHEGFRPLPTGQECAIVFPISFLEEEGSPPNDRLTSLLMDPFTFEQQFAAMTAGDCEGPLAEDIQHRAHASLGSGTRKPELVSIERVFPPYGHPEDYSFLATTSHGERFFGRLSESSMTHVWMIREFVHYQFGIYGPKAGFSGAEGIDHSLVKGTASHFESDGFEPTILDEDSVVRDYLGRVQRNFENSTQGSFAAKGWSVSGKLLGFDKKQQAPMWLLLCSISDQEGRYVLPSTTSCRALLSQEFAGFVVSAYPNATRHHPGGGREFLELRAFVLPEETMELALTELALRPKEALLSEPLRRRVVRDLIERQLLSKKKSRSFHLEKVGTAFCGSDGVDDFYAVCCKHRLGETILILRRKLSSGGVLHGDDYTIWGFAPKRNCGIPHL